MTEKPLTPLERLVRLGWDALDKARKTQAPTLEQLTQNARDALETARRGLLDETALKHYAFSAPMDNATAADVELELSVGEASVYAMEDRPHDLILADLMYLGALSFGVTGEMRRHVFLRQAMPLTVGWANPVHWTSRPRWDVRLTKQVPLDLFVKAGVGDVDLNLSYLNIRNLRLIGNIGPINMTLPTHAPSLIANVTAAAGPIAINVPAEAAAVLDVQGGVGGLAVNIEAGAAVRIQVSGGVGDVAITPGFDRTEASAPGLRNTAVWQTPDFDVASQRVAINLAEGMVGSLNVRMIRV